MKGMQGTRLLLPWMFAAAFPAAAASLTFEKDVRPILKAHCFQCHGEEGEMKGGLDVRLAHFILKGGKHGPAIVAGDAAKSHLLELVKEGEMPKGKTKLKDKDIATLEAWIAEGAKTARPEPEKLGPEHAFTDEERAWWSLQPLQAVKAPAQKTASGIEIALWDLAGRLLQTPVCNLLGGRFRDYWHANGGLAQFGYPLTEEITEGRDLFRSRVTPELFRRNYFDRAIVDRVIKPMANLDSKIW